MLFYKRASYYIFIHFFFGFISAWIPWIGVVALMYQFFQFYMNIRIFPIEGTIEYGNSVAHTGLKLTEMGVGYISGILLKETLDI